METPSKDGSAALQESGFQLAQSNSAEQQHDQGQKDKKVTLRKRPANQPPAIKEGRSLPLQPLNKLSIQNVVSPGPLETCLRWNRRNVAVQVNAVGQTLRLEFWSDFNWPESNQNKSEKHLLVNIEQAEQEEPPDKKRKCTNEIEVIEVTTSTAASYKSRYQQSTSNGQPLKLAGSCLAMDIIKESQKGPSQNQFSELRCSSQSKEMSAVMKSLSVSWTRKDILDLMDRRNGGKETLAVLEKRGFRQRTEGLAPLERSRNDVEKENSIWKAQESQEKSHHKGSLPFKSSKTVNVEEGHNSTMTPSVNAEPNVPVPVMAVDALESISSNSMSVGQQNSGSSVFGVRKKPSVERQCILIPALPLHKRLAVRDQQTPKGVKRKINLPKNLPPSKIPPTWKVTSVSAAPVSVAKKAGTASEKPKQCQLQKNCLSPGKESHSSVDQNTCSVPKSSKCKQGSTKKKTTTKKDDLVKKLKRQNQSCLPEEETKKRKSKYKEPSTEAPKTVSGSDCGNDVITVNAVSSAIPVTCCSAEEQQPVDTSIASSAEPVTANEISPVLEDVPRIVEVRSLVSDAIGEQSSQNSPPVDVSESKVENQDGSGSTDSLSIERQSTPSALRKADDQMDGAPSAQQPTAPVPQNEQELVESSGSGRKADDQIDGAPSAQQPTAPVPQNEQELVESSGSGRKADYQIDGAPAQQPTPVPKNEQKLVESSGSGDLRSATTDSSQLQDVIKPALWNSESVMLVLDTLEEYQCDAIKICSDDGEGDGESKNIFVLSSLLESTDVWKLHIAGGLLIKDELDDVFPDLVQESKDTLYTPTSKVTSETKDALDMPRSKVTNETKNTLESEGTSAFIDTTGKSCSSENVGLVDNGESTHLRTAEFPLHRSSSEVTVSENEGRSSSSGALPNEQPDVSVIPSEPATDTPSQADLARERLDQALAATEGPTLSAVLQNGRSSAKELTFVPVGNSHSRHNKRMDDFVCQANSNHGYLRAVETIVLDALKGDTPTSSATSTHSPMQPSLITQLPVRPAAPFSQQHAAHLTAALHNVTNRAVNLMRAATRMPVETIVLDAPNSDTPTSSATSTHSPMQPSLITQLPVRPAAPFSQQHAAHLTAALHNVTNRAVNLTRAATRMPLMTALLAHGQGNQSNTTGSSPVSNMPVATVAPPLTHSASHQLGSTETTPLNRPNCGSANPTSGERRIVNRAVSAMSLPVSNAGMHTAAMHSSPPPQSSTDSGQCRNNAAPHLNPSLMMHSASHQVGSVATNWPDRPISSSLANQLARVIVNRATNAGLLPVVHAGLQHNYLLPQSSTDVCGQCSKNAAVHSSPIPSHASQNVPQSQCSSCSKNQTHSAGVGANFPSAIHPVVGTSSQAQGHVQYNFSNKQRSVPSNSSVNNNVPTTMPSRANVQSFPWPLAAYQQTGYSGQIGVRPPSVGCTPVSQPGTSNRASPANSVMAGPVHNQPMQPSFSGTSNRANPANSVMAGPVHNQPMQPSHTSNRANPANSVMAGSVHNQPMQPSHTSNRANPANSVMAGPVHNQPMQPSHTSNRTNPANLVMAGPVHNQPMQPSHTSNRANPANSVMAGPVHNQPMQPSFSGTSNRTNPANPVMAGSVHNQPMQPSHTSNRANPANSVMAGPVHNQPMQPSFSGTSNRTNPVNSMMMTGPVHNQPMQPSISGTSNRTNPANPLMVGPVYNQPMPSRIATNNPQQQAELRVPSGSLMVHWHAEPMATYSQPISRNVMSGHVYPGTAMPVTPGVPPACQQPQQWPFSYPEASNVMQEYVPPPPPPPYPSIPSISSGNFGATYSQPSHRPQHYQLPPAATSNQISSTVTVTSPSYSAVPPVPTYDANFTRMPVSSSSWYGYPQQYGYPSTSQGYQMPWSCSGTGSSVPSTSSNAYYGGSVAVASSRPVSDAPMASSMQSMPTEPQISSAAQYPVPGNRTAASQNQLERDAAMMASQCVVSAADSVRQVIK